MDPRQALLEVDRIDAGYGDVQALWGVSLDLREREIVALLGSNGAGKTTILRAISGLIPTWGGTIRFEGQALDRLAPSEIVARGVVHVPEGRHVFPKMTVLENLRAGAYTAAAWRRQRESLAEVFDLFPRLRERAGQYAGTLSGGEQQMLAIARGLMSGPRVLLIDEPSLGLAPVIVDAVYATFGRIRELGCALVIVEQNLQRALAVADRAYVVTHGRVTMAGTSQQVAADPEIRQAYLGM